MGASACAHPSRFACPPQSRATTNCHNPHNRLCLLKPTLTKGLAMSADKTTQTLIDALKQGMAEPGEHRLYKSGKLAGLFPGRTGAHIEAARQALRDGFLEVVRSETK